METDDRGVSRRCKPYPDVRFTRTARSIEQLEIGIRGELGFLWENYTVRRRFVLIIMIGMGNYLAGMSNVPVPASSTVLQRRRPPALHLLV